MGQVDWQAVYQNYLPLAKKVSTRAELSDVIAEMQGELGSSHAYVWVEMPLKRPFFHKVI